MNNIYKKSKKLKAALCLMALSALGALLLPARAVLADGESGWGDEIKDAAETVLVTKLFLKCVENERTVEYHADENVVYMNGANAYVTEGWSLFSDSPKTAFSVGSWLESKISGPFGDGQVWCKESPNGAGYKDNDGSEIIRLLSYYLLGGSDLKTMRDQLFCNKYDSKQFGLTVPLIEGNYDGIADDCSVFDGNIYHLLVGGGSRNVSGNIYYYGIDYIKQLYENKRLKNSFLPSWYDIDSAIKSDNVLRYYMFLNDYDAGSCMATPVTYGGNLIKLVNNTTGEITEQRFEKRTKDDYDGLGDDDWDKVFYQIVTGGGDYDGNCQDKYPNEINKLAPYVQAAIEKERGGAKDSNVGSTIEACYNSSHVMLTEARSKNSITFLEQKAKDSNGRDATVKDVISEIFSRAYYDVLVLKTVKNDISISTIKNSYFDESGQPKETTARQRFNTIKDRKDWPTDGVLSLNNVSELVNAIDNTRNKILPMMVLTDEEFAAQYSGNKNTTIDENIRAFYNEVANYVDTVARLVGGGTISYDNTSDTYRLQTIGDNESGYSVFKRYSGYLDKVKSSFARCNTITGGAVDCYFYFDDENKNNIYDSEIKNVIDITTIYQNTTINQETINNNEDNICTFGKNFANDANGKLSLDGVSFNFSASSIKYKEPTQYTEYGEGTTYNYGETCESSAGLGWILCPVTKFVVQTADSLYEKVANKWIQVKTEYTNSEGVRSAWSAFVGFANIILVILFLFIIFSQLTGFGIDNYGIKRALPKIIVVAVLINLSFIICQLAVDVTNILGANFEGLFDAINIPKSTVPATGDPLPSILGNLLAIGGLAVAGVTVFTAVKSGGLGKFVAGLLIPLLITFLVALIGIFFFFVIMGIRQAGIVTLIAISPVAIVCYALPNTKKYFDRWFNGFKGLILVYPICGLMLGASRMVARLISSVGEQDLAANMVACAVLVFPFFVMPEVITRAVSAITQLGEKVAQLGRGIRQRADKGIRNSEAYKHAEEGWKQAGEERRRMIRNALNEKEKGRIDNRQRRRSARLDKRLDKRKNKIAERDWSDERKEAAIAAAEQRFSEKKNKKSPVLQARINELNKNITAANMQNAENENPADVIDINLARLRVAAKREGEKYQGYKDQHSQENKKTLQNHIINAGNNIDEKNASERSVEMRAMSDTMAKNGDIEDLMDSYFRIDDEHWKVLAQNDNARSNMVSALAGSGSQIAKGYAKYLEKMGQEDHGKEVVGFEDWIKNGDARYGSEKFLKDSGLGGWQDYNNLKFDGDPYANMQKDELKFVKNNGLSSLSKEQAAGNLAAVTQGALNKSGEERVIMNQMLEQTVAGLDSEMPLDQKIKALKLSPDSLTKMDMSNMNAIFAGLRPEAFARNADGSLMNPTLADAVKQQIIAALQPLAQAAAGDKRIRNKMTDDMRELFNIEIEQTGNPPQNGGPTMGDRSSSSYDGDESGY